MAALQAEELTVFYCYAHEDQEFQGQLEQHLSNLKRLYHLKTWFDHQILPGENWERILEEKLQMADLIFLLISPAFMASEYCYTKEMSYALARHNQGETRVIPILLRPVHWKNAPFSTIQMLPDGALPVTSWQNSDDAFYNIILGIERIIEDLLFRRQNSGWHRTQISEQFPHVHQSQDISQVRDKGTNEHHIEHNTSPLEEALGTHKRAPSSIFSNIATSISQGDTLHKLGKYQEAIYAYMRAIDFNLNTVLKNFYKGDALADLQKAEETLALDSRSIVAYRNKVSALLELQRYEEALLACEQFMQPDFYIMAADYNNQAYAFAILGRYDEALQACERALRLKPRLASTYKNKAYALYGLKCYEDSLQACEQAISFKPDLAAAYALMGMALFQLEKAEQSSSAFSLWSPTPTNSERGL